MLQSYVVDLFYNKLSTDHNNIEQVKFGYMHQKLQKMHNARLHAI